MNAYFAVFITVALCLNTYLMFRNKWVRDFMLEQVHASEVREGGVLYPYCLLPSYERVLYTFWVFDFYAFYPEEYRQFIQAKAEPKEDAWSL